MLTLPIELDARRQPPLGQPAARFLRDYWQKRPLLIRNAFPGFVPPISPDDLAGLSCEDGTLGRLVQHDRARDHWQVQSGPFAEAAFSELGERDWTLLVQDVDKWDADVRALLTHFDFLPRWRLDDVMVSFAAPGGSVGAHVDQYDVFLLQAQGERRWQIDASESITGQRPALDFRDDVELKLLREFSPSHDWVLNPGDMLYLPPNVPHHGIAETPCLTFSFGMRAPSVAELMGDWLDTLLMEADDALRYTDPDLTPPRDPCEIDAAAMTRVVTALNTLRMDDPERLGDWFGRFITTYRSAGTVAAGPDLPPWEVALAHVKDGGLLHRHPFSRMAWRRTARAARLYVSGSEWPLPVKDARLLANTGTVTAEVLARLSAQGRQALQALYQAGHYHCAAPAGPAGTAAP